MKDGDELTVIQIRHKSPVVETTLNVPVSESGIISQPHLSRNLSLSPLPLSPLPLPLTPLPTLLHTLTLLPSSPDRHQHHFHHLHYHYRFHLHYYYGYDYYHNTVTFSITTSTSTVSPSYTLIWTTTTSPMVFFLLSLSRTE